MSRIFVAMTGASGAAYGVGLVHALLEAGVDVHLCVSRAARQVLAVEMEVPVDSTAFDPAPFVPPGARAPLRYHSPRDLKAPVASGSFLTGGVVVCPCSMGTLGRIAAGLSRNLIERAADVALKERRPLVLVPRETPLSLVHLRNMVTVTEAGATVLPAMPGFYHRPRSVEDLVTFVVGKILDRLGITHPRAPRWGGS